MKKWISVFLIMLWVLSGCASMESASGTLSTNSSGEESQDYPEAYTLQYIIQVGDLLYFSKAKDVGDRNEIQICSIEEDGSNETIIYSFETDGQRTIFMRISNEKFMFFVPYNAQLKREAGLAIYNINTKDIFVYETNRNMYGPTYYNEELYYVEYGDENFRDDGKLYRLDESFNETLLLEDVMDFQICQDQIFYMSEYNLFSCDLDGNNSRKGYKPQTYVSTYFSVHDGVVYLYDHKGTWAFDFETGKKELRIPGINCYFDQYRFDAFFICGGSGGKNIYKISYDFEEVEIIAEYYADIYLIGDYIYLSEINYADLYPEDYEEFGIRDGIYRMRLDGSGFEKFVSTMVS